MNPVRDGQPLFPITVTFSDGETILLEDETDAALNLEWFDSAETQEGVASATVVDQLGRRVRLRIEKLQVVWCELE